jgi:hypothetical protein
VADGIFEQIGEAVSPLGGAVDFLAPPAQARGAGFSLGELFGSLKAGAVDAISEGPAAIAGGIKGAFDPTSGLSARDRLLIGGLSVAGTGMMARQVHRAWKASMSPVTKSAPVGYGNLYELGDVRRNVELSTPAGLSVMSQYPGVNIRQAEILAANDYEGVIRPLRRWQDNPEADVAAQTLFERYANTVEGAEAAQVDWARFDHAVERGIFAYNQNARVRSLWKKLVTEPQNLSDAESDELFGIVRQVSEATQAAGHDFSVGVVGRIERIDVTDAGPIVYTRVPHGWTEGSTVDRSIREQRLMHLNYRQLADRGKYMLRTLYQIGIDDWNRPEGAPRRLPAELEVGPEWYPTARHDVAKAFGYGLEDSPELQRAVAAVSFLSEAEDWSTNIGKAQRLLTDQTVAPALTDPDFTAWLRSGSQIDASNPKLGRYEYAGKRQTAHEATFEALHKHATSSGFKVSKADLRVVLRLMGDEDLTAIFRSTQRRKQKNFYLNIYHPELPYPVTIDRHAFDAYLGIDSGVNDRPIDLSTGEGEQVYDVIADTYRAVAEELGILPHELQAVVWETWRMLKGASGRNGWGRNDPFMLPEADGSENVVYGAFNGRGLYGGEQLQEHLPADVLDISTTGMEAAALPDGSVAYIADITDETSAKLRNLYPAINGADNVPRWAPVRPEPVFSLAPIKAAAERGAIAETYVGTMPHPVLDPSESVMFELPDGVKPPRLRGVRPERFARVAVSEPEYSLQRLGIEDLEPGTFQDSVRSPLKTHAWAAISADLNDDQVRSLGFGDYEVTQARRALRAELERRGFKPIDMEGIYEGGSEPSFLVFGITPDEALELGEKFGQDSVATNYGLLYSRRGAVEPANLDRSAFPTTEALYGAGNVDAVFKGAPKTVAPWPSAGRLKSGKQWDKDLIKEAMQDKPPVEMIDPRYLHSTQREVVLEHAKRYMDDPKAKPLAGDSSNNDVWIYERLDGRRDILTGHHRALRALLQGTELEARVIREAKINAGRDIEYNIPPEADYRSKLVIGGQEVTFATDIDFTDQRYRPSQLLPRTERQAQKYVAKLAGKRDIVELAEEIEAKGGRNVGIYTSRPEVDGWVRAVDNVYTDGVSTHVTRTKDAEYISPQSGPVFVRSTDGLPDGPTAAGPSIEQVGPGLVRLSNALEIRAQGELKVGDSPLSVTLNGEPVKRFALNGRTLTPLGADTAADLIVVPGKKTVIETTTDDVLPAAEARTALRAVLGDSPIELKTPKGRFSFPSEPKTQRRGTVLLKNGLKIKAPHRDKPLKDWEADFGIEFDPGYRNGRQVLQLPDDTIAELRQAMELVFPEYEPALRRWRLSRISVSDGLPDAYAQLHWQAGGPIVLSKDWWSDIPAMVESLKLERAQGHLSRRAAPTPASILLHELGHVVHGSIRLGEGMVKSSDFDRTVAKAVSYSRYNEPWSSVASREISHTAGTEISELVAEAFSEVYSSENASALANRIVDLTLERLHDSLKYRKLTGL